MKLLDRMSDQWFRNIVSQPERVGQTEYVDRNPYNIAHPLKESHWLPRTILAMLPKGGLLSGFTQEDYARLQDPTDRTLFGGDPTGNPRWSPPPITERGLAKFGLFTDALDWLPGFAALGATTRAAGRLGRKGRAADRDQGCTAYNRAACARRGDAQAATTQTTTTSESGNLGTNSRSAHGR